MLVAMEVVCTISRQSGLGLRDAHHVRCKDSVKEVEPMFLDRWLDMCAIG
jgi:hypothetical protein